MRRQIFITLIGLAAIGASCSNTTTGSLTSPSVATDLSTTATNAAPPTTTTAVLPTTTVPPTTTTTIQTVYAMSEDYFVETIAVI